MDLKRLLMLKGMTQIELAKMIGVHQSVLNLQLNMHRLLPEKHLDKFCSLLEIKRADLEEAIKKAGGLL